MNAHTPRNAEAAQPVEPEWIGRVIDDRYKVVEHLGEGGMGAVYVAEHLKLRKEVALKVIHPEFAGDGEVAARFAREAMASAQLEHPHVASALDFGTLPEGGAYLVMQLVRGKSVQEQIEEHGPVEWKLACEIAAQVADALAAAHAGGIVHRDLKPDNILLQSRADSAPQVKVLDFGIARVAMEEGRRAPEGAEPGRALTRVGTVMGTPGYMAPEQAMGERVDARADLYSLGVVLWEMIVGRDMFGTRELTEIVTRQLTEPAPPLSANAPGAVPTELDGLVRAMLAGKASDRPENASMVRDELRRMAFGSTGPVSGQWTVPAERGSDGSAHTVLAKATPPPTRDRPAAGPGHVPAAGPAQVPATSPGVHPTPTVPGLTVPGLIARLPEALRRVQPKWLAAGCGGLAVLALAAVVGMAAFGGEDEPDPTKPANQGSGFSISKLLNLAPIPMPGPTIPPEVQERIDVVMEGRDRRDRDAAAEWLLAHEPASEVPDFATAVAELETVRGCRAKKAIVERIRDEELVGALPALRRIADSPRRGCGFLGVNDCYGCMRGELRDTIGVLEGDDPEADDESEQPERKRRGRR